MGFPLSTDIFGQLKWLIKEVKQLLFRVKKLENGGGGGVGNLQTVTNNGSTTTNQITAFSFFTGYGNGITDDGQVLTEVVTFRPSITDNTKQVLLAPRTDLNISTTLNLPNPTSGYQVLALSVNGSYADANGNINIPPPSIGIDTVIGSNPYLTTNRQIIVANGTDPTYGLEIVNSSGDVIAHFNNQYVSFNGGLQNGVNITSLEIKDNFIITYYNGNPLGLYVNGSHGTVTLGQEGAGGGSPFFGIVNDNASSGKAARLYAGNLRDTSTYYTPNGFIPIEIDGSMYYIELWT